MTAAVADQTLIDVPCPACGSHHRRTLAHEGPLGIVQCQCCKLAYTSPRYKAPQAHYLGEREGILRKYGYPPDLEDAAVRGVLAQAEAMLTEMTV